MINLPVYRKGQIIYEASGIPIIELNISEDDNKSMDFIVNAINKYNELKEELDAVNDERLELVEQME